MTTNLPGPIQEDEYATDGIVTLVGPNGENIDFIEIITVAHKGNLYAILQPVELFEGMEENEAIVFRMDTDEEGNDQFHVVLDDVIIDAVFAEYNRILDKIESESE